MLAFRLFLLLSLLLFVESVKTPLSACLYSGYGERLIDITKFILSRRRFARYGGI